MSVIGRVQRMQKDQKTTVQRTQKDQKQQSKEHRKTKNNSPKTVERQTKVSCPETMYTLKTAPKYG